jgi:ankyrin repeat protein
LTPREIARYSASAAQAAIGPRKGSNPPVHAQLNAFFLPERRGHRALRKEGVSMAASLPARPSLEWLRKTAKARLSQLRATEPDAKLADAQRALAREHGFPSWRKLKAHVEASAGRLDRFPDDQAVGRFLRLVGMGQIDEVRATLATAPELVNAVGPHPFWGGRPQALHLAIEGGRRDLFDLLLEHGAVVNGTNDQYELWSPLMIAMNRDRADMRDELLGRGARIGLVEALMLADDDRVEELLRDGRLPDLAPNGGSILAFARTPFAIDRLIALGAKTDAKDRWGATPIEAMSRLGPGGQALVRHMIGRGVVASPQEYARLGDREMLERMIERDATVARLDVVMMGAVDFQHHALVEWLLERGGDANARSDAESRHTALHSAAWNGDLRMVRLLLAAGADPATRDEQYDGTPLSWAETSVNVTNNPRCAEVAAYLRAATGGETKP